MLEEEAENCDLIENDECLECKKGYFFNGETCEKLKIEDCESGFNSTCTKCNPGFDLNYGACLLSRNI